MYMTCLATFTMPTELYECANVNLFEGYTLPPTTSIATSTLPTSSLLVFNTLTGPVVASATSSSSSPPGSKSTTTITNVITVTACPPDITNCPTSSTYLRTITTTSVTSFGGGTTSSAQSMPVASTSAISTTTVTRGAREADLCVLKKQTRAQRRDEVRVGDIEKR